MVDSSTHIFCYTSSLTWNSYSASVFRFAILGICVPSKTIYLKFRCTRDRKECFISLSSSSNVCNKKKPLRNHFFLPNWMKNLFHSSFGVWTCAYIVYIYMCNVYFWLGKDTYNIYEFVFLKNLSECARLYVKRVNVPRGCRNLNRKYLEFADNVVTTIRVACGYSCTRYYSHQFSSRVCEKSATYL